MSDQTTNDLNEVIATAVKARIESQVSAALAGDAMIGKYVTAALTREVTVRDSYRGRKTTFLGELLERTIRSATEDAVKRLVSDETPKIEEAVRAELAASTTEIARQLVGSVTEAAAKAYGVQVTLKFPERS